MKPTRLIIPRLAGLLMSVALLAAPATANTGDDRAVVGPGSRIVESLGSVLELGPETGGPVVPAGSPYVGLDNITSESLLATGAQLRQRRSGIDPLHPDLAALMEAQPETILGWDSRMRFNTASYPNRAIVYISYNGGHLCTGFLVSRNTVITSGHCVHTGGASGSWRQARLFTVHPGRDGAASPYGSCGVTRLHSVLGWTRNRNPNHDYGALRLNCTVGTTVGWFGSYAPTNAELSHAPTRVIGYPGDKAQQQWGSSDKVRRREARMLCYRDDTIGGNSGGPVWNDRNQALFASGAWAFGVHGYGVGGSVCGGAGNQLNGAVRIVSPVLTNISNWIAAQ